MTDMHTSFEMAQISHELANPITLIYSSLQRMEKEHPEIGAYPYWSGIMDEMHHVQHLLRDLRLLQADTEIHPAPFSFIEFAQETACALQAFLQERKQTLLLQCPLEIPTLSADKFKLRQVIENLIKNASDASKANEIIAWHIRLEETTLISEIIDSGCGIAPGFEALLFEPFITSKADGTGLGLPICKQIIEGHGGQLTYRKNPSGGTTFSFTLPVPEKTTAIIP